VPSPDWGAVSWPAGSRWHRAVLGSAANGAGPDGDSCRCGAGPSGVIARVGADARSAPVVRGPPRRCRRSSLSSPPLARSAGTGPLHAVASRDRGWRPLPTGHRSCGHHHHRRTPGYEPSDRADRRPRRAVRSPGLVGGPGYRHRRPEGRVNLREVRHVVPRRFPAGPVLPRGVPDGADLRLARVRRVQPAGLVAVRRGHRRLVVAAPVPPAPGRPAGTGHRRRAVPADATASRIQRSRPCTNRADTSVGSLRACRTSRGRIGADTASPVSPGAGAAGVNRGCSSLRR